MDLLRTQVIETQKARSDLMKWKLILVAGLGTFGLGLGNIARGPCYPILCLVPFVCNYVDALCAHLSIRIQAIGDFLASETPNTSEEKREHNYEVFFKNHSPSVQIRNFSASLVNNIIITLCSRK